MKAIDLLKEEGYTLRKRDNKWVSPAGRGVSKDVALNRLAKQRGYGSYKILQSIERSKEFKTWKKWYEKVQGTIDRNFYILFAKASRQGFKPFSQSLIDLMRTTTFQEGSDGSWYHGLAWKNYGFGKYYGEF